MAKRFVYHATEKAPFYEALATEFEWFSGFSTAQKQKSIDALHESCKKTNPSFNILEVSGKSRQELGVKLSAFNLELHDEHGSHTVECLFQGSKEFNSLIRQDLYEVSSKEARKVIGSANYGIPKAFRLWDIRFPSEPKNAFYNWLYIRALCSNPELAKEIIEYDSFTDIEFNPKRSINCQAIAAATYIGLLKAGKLKQAMKSPETFIKVVYEKNPPIKILYVHGYLGRGYGESSERIRKEFVSREIPCILDAPSFPVTDPKATKDKIKSLIEENRYDVVVASSLGAFYTMQIPGIKKILVNIALPENLKRIKDSKPEHNPDLSPEFFAKIEKEKDAFFSEVFNDAFRQETYIIYGTRDKIAANEDFFKQYFNDDSRVCHIDMDYKLDVVGAQKVVEIICIE